MIYVAYGSNLNKGQMSLRCPNAVALGKMYLPDYKLVFRGVADIEESKGDYVPVGLWEVTADCITSLDRYEGTPILYSRVDIGVGFTYQMNNSGYASPSINYLRSIYQGYLDFDFNDDDINTLLSGANYQQQVG